MRKSTAAVVFAVIVFGCGPWFEERLPEGVELYVEALEIPDWADWDETITVRDTVHNWGDQPADPFDVKFYLSADDEYDALDVEIGSRLLVLGLASNEHDAAETPVTLPASGGDGPYYIIAYVDPDNFVIEVEGGEDTNTFAAGPIDVYTPPAGIDLVIKSVSGPAGAEWGDPIQVDYTVRNRGTEDCFTDFDVSFYLSSDETLDGLDQLMGSDTVVGGLAGKTEADRVASVTIPVLGTDGDHYIIADADPLPPPDGVVAEVSNDFANDKASDEQIYVANLPNLTVALVGVSDPTPHWGQSVTVTVRVSEARGNPTPPGTQIQVKVYLSQNTTIETADDLLLSTLWTTPLVGYESRDLSTSVVINQKPFWTDGTYYVIAYVDSAQDVAEYDETDNTEWSSVSVTAPVTDMYEPNNTAASAYLLPGYIGWAYPTISPSGDVDWFYFQAPYGSQVQVELYPVLGEDYDLQVYYTAFLPGPGTLIFQGTLAGPGVPEIWDQWGMPAGYYFIKVWGKSSSDWSAINYSLFYDD